MREAPHGYKIYAAIACFLVAAPGCTQRGDSGPMIAYGDRGLISAYNIPMGGGPQMIEPAKAIPGTEVWEGEVLGTSSGGHYHETPTERSYYFQPSEFTVKAAHPFNRKTFSIVVGESVIDFCGVNKEVKDLGNL